MRRTAPWILAAALAAASPAAADAPQLAAAAAPAPAPAVADPAPGDPRAYLDGAAWDELRRGEILVEHDPEKRRAGFRLENARAIGFVAHPPDRVWDTLVDFERWPEFLPDLDSLRVLDRRGPHVRLRSEIGVLFFSMSHTVRYEVLAERFRLDWELDPSEPHDVRWIEGVWALWPVEGGSLASYRVRIDPGRYIPGWLRRRLLSGSLPEVIRGLRGAVEERSGG